VEVQCSAHGEPALGIVNGGAVAWVEPHRRIAPGQSVVAYLDEPGIGPVVVGGGIATRP
jgi:hypothetical protein